MNISDRQIFLLKIIVEQYTLTAQPVPSKFIAKNFMRNLSPQTIRNELLALEKMGYLEKTHISSGRIPSTKGYRYYQDNILKPTISNDVKNKLHLILEKRDVSIDTIIDESASLIEEILKLPTVINSINDATEFKRFDLISISKEKVIVLLVTSDGEVIKNTITIANNSQLEDVIICIRIFNDRLVDTKIIEFQDRIEVIKELIRNQVHQYEFCIQQIVKKIFEHNTTNKTNIHGLSKLVAQPEFRDTEKLQKVLDLLENTSVWKHIAYTQEQAGNDQIIFNNNVGVKDVTVASTSIRTKNSTKQLSVVGPSRMNYNEVKGLLQFIKEELEKIALEDDKKED